MHLTVFNTETKQYVPLRQRQWTLTFDLKNVPNPAEWLPVVAAEGNGPTPLPNIKDGIGNDYIDHRSPTTKCEFGPKLVRPKNRPGIFMQLCFRKRLPLCYFTVVIVIVITAIVVIGSREDTRGARSTVADSQEKSKEADKEKSYVDVTSTMNSPKAEDPVFRSEEAICAYTQNLLSVFRRLKADSQVFIVEFICARGGPDGRPLTFVGSDFLRIKGEFKLISTLSDSTTAEWKTVDLLVKVEYNQRSGNGDQRYMQLRDLLKCSNQFEPLVLLAVGEKGVEDVSKFTFLGPLGRKDYYQIPTVVKSLLSKPFSELGYEDCQRMLGSKLVWEKLVGFARLTELKRISPADFGKSLENVDVSDVGHLLYEMFSVLPTFANASQITEQLVSTHFSKEIQIRILETVIEWLRDDMHAARSSVDLPKLKRLAEHALKTPVGVGRVKTPYESILERVANLSVE